MKPWRKLLLSTIIRVLLDHMVMNLWTKKLMQLRPEVQRQLRGALHMIQQSVCPAPPEFLVKKSQVTFMVTLDSLTQARLLLGALAVVLLVIIRVVIKKGWEANPANRLI